MGIFLCIRELLFTLFKIKHFFIYARQTVQKSELACKIRNFSARVQKKFLFCTPIHFSGLFWCAK